MLEQAHEFCPNLTITADQMDLLVDAYGKDIGNGTGALKSVPTFESSLLFFLCFISSWKIWSGLCASTCKQYFYICISGITFIMIILFAIVFLLAQPLLLSNWDPRITRIRGKLILAEEPTNLTIHFLSKIVNGIFLKCK